MDAELAAILVSFYEFLKKKRESPAQPPVTAFVPSHLSFGFGATPLLSDKPGVNVHRWLHERTGVPTADILIERTVKSDLGYEVVAAVKRLQTWQLWQAKTDGAGRVLTCKAIGVRRSHP